MEPADSNQVSGSEHDTDAQPREEDESEDTIMMARHHKRFRMEEMFPVIAAEEPPPPVFHEDDKAAVVFENVYFYGSEAYLQMFRKEREQVLQNMTVKQVFLQYTVASGIGEDGLYKLVNPLRAMQDRVLKYYKAAIIKLSVEDCLDARGTISLSVQDEKDMFRECKPCHIPTATKIWTDTSNRRNYKGEKKRSLPLGLVLGPSGSGKTFFALYELSRKFLVGSATRKVTIYLQAKDVPVKFNALTGHEAVPALVAWIKKCLARDTNIELPENIPLKMHICIIIDEAGVAECRWWFENKTMLCALCQAVKNLATSVAVVVAGTGLTGNSLSSSDDAYLFRMKPWQAKDVARILENYETSLKLVGEETPKFVADAIFASSKLGALASNARSAFYLVQAIAQRSQYFSRLSWTYQLEDWTRALVMQVVYEYMCSNRICNLSKPEQRRVTASIFCALRRSKPRDAQLLHMPGLNEKEITVGESLLQFNCENVNGKLKLVDEEPFAYTVTPVMAIVLYAMLGINASLNPGWKAGEEVAALFAVQQWAINTMERYISDGDRVNLDRSLEQVRVISLQKQVKSANSKKSILIPRVGPGAIVINGDKAPFADVIAPYLLIQCKHDTSSSNLTTSVNLYDEMKKSSLLKKRECDTRVLRGLVEMWKGNLEPTGNLRNQSDQHQRRADRNPQLSNAFPSNLQCLVPQIDPVEYAIIEGEHIIIGKKRRLLPPLDGTTTITFMVSTNMDQIHLTLSPRGDTITLTEDNLDEDLQMNENLLGTSEQNRWKRFKRQVRDEVVIKFLLTKSV